MDLATVDHLLGTTRSVRKRLDLKRPVPADLVARCPGMRPIFAADDPRTRQLPRIVESAAVLAEHLHEVPVDGWGAHRG